jgi:uncharacterized repeat protein (TIGR01451 family)
MQAGLWKLMAMAAVIGGGVCAVWQAQQGLTASNSTGVAATEGSPTPLSAKSSATRLIPSDPLSMGVASVPPEAADDEREAHIEADPFSSNADTDGASARGQEKPTARPFRRSVDFRDAPLAEQPTEPDAVGGGEPISFDAIDEPMPLLVPSESTESNPAGSATSKPIEPYTRGRTDSGRNEPSRRDQEEVDPFQVDGALSGDNRDSSPDDSRPFGTRSPSRQNAPAVEPGTPEMGEFNSLPETTADPADEMTIPEADPISDPFSNASPPEFGVSPDDAQPIERMSGSDSAGRAPTNRVRPAAADSNDAAESEVDPFELSDPNRALPSAEPQPLERDNPPATNLGPLPEPRSQGVPRKSFGGRSERPADDAPAALPSSEQPLEPLPESLGDDRMPVPGDDNGQVDPFASDPPPTSPNRSPMATDDAAGLGDAPSLSGSTDSESMNLENGTAPTAAPKPARTAPPADTFDPFPDDAASRSRQPAESDESLRDDASSAREPTGNPQRLTAPPPNAAATTPVADPLRGDAVVGETAPRGVQEPRLVIEKTAPAKAVLGQPVIYTIMIRNVGGSPASQVVVEDRIPRGARLVGTAPRAELIDRRLLWKNIGTLQPNEDRKISIKLIPEEEGPIGSVAKVSFAAEVAAEIVITAPQLQMRVSGPETVKLGESVPLVFKVVNLGDGEASNVVVRSLIPAGLKHPAGEDLEYAIGRLAPKESREVRLEMVADRPGIAVHEAVLSADGNLTVDVKTNIEVDGEQLLLTRTGHPQVYVGRQVTFTNQVTNEGPKGVTGIRVTEQVPDQFEYVSASHQGEYDPVSRSISWFIGSMPAGGSSAVSCVLMPKRAGNCVGEVTASGPLGSAATVQPEVLIEGIPALSVEQLAENGLVAVGERVTLRMSVKNRGSGPAENVRFSVELPPEVKLLDARGPGGQPTVRGSTVSFESVTTVPPQGHSEFELQLEAVTAGDVRLIMQLDAGYLRKPVRSEEPLQIIEQ